MNFSVRELSPATLRASDGCIFSGSEIPAELREFAAQALTRLLLVEGPAGEWEGLLRAGVSAAGGRACFLATAPRVRILLALSEIGLGWLDADFSGQAAVPSPLSAELHRLLVDDTTSSGLWSFSGRTMAVSARPCIMGVLNVTPDSFSDGNRFFDLDRALDHALEMVAEGADIIDIGGESTRPDAAPVAEDEELRRVVPVVAKLAEQVTVPLSIDTYKAAVARESLQAGASIINDISGLTFDPEMAAVVAAGNAGLVVMHTRGRPPEMQYNTVYDDLISEVIEALKTSLQCACSAGIPAERIVVDPGLGFGKSLEGNLAILNRLDEFACLGRPVLIGTSRKSFVGAVLKRNSSDRLFGTAATVALGVAKGATIFRVHDVKAMRDVADMAFAVTQSRTGEWR